MKQYAVSHKFWALIATVIVSGSTASGQLFPKKFKLPDGKIKRKTVCMDCRPGNLGVPFYFGQKPYAPDVEENSTSKDIAYQLCGRTYPEDNLRGDRALTCSKTSENPFSLNDITAVGFTGRDISYKRTERLNIDIKAAVETNLEELRKFTSDQTKLQSLEASIKTAYEKIAGKDLTIEGKYYEYGLKQNVIDKLIKEDGFQECKKFLLEEKYRIITAVGLVYFNASYNENSLDKLAAEVQAAVEAQGIKANISFTFKREVSKNLRTVTNNLFQVMVWRSANPNDIHLFAFAGGSPQP